MDQVQVEQIFPFPSSRTFGEPASVMRQANLMIRDPYGLSCEKTGSPLAIIARALTGPIAASVGDDDFGKGE